LEKTGRERAQVFDFDLAAGNEVFRSMLYDNDPAERGNRKNDEPENDTKTEHLATLPSGGNHCKVVRRGCESLA